MTTSVNASRQLFELALRPVLGERFQPAGFPDIGPALFDRPMPDGNGTQRALLVESAQSMANHLEAAGWSTGDQQPLPALDGLPYVRVVAGDDGRYLASSRTEAHRLASAFVKDSLLDGKPMREVVKERLGLRDDTPLAPRQIAAALFALDPLCLVHGVFFAESAEVWPGQPRIARALTGFVEAHGVREAVSGGVKRDAVRHSTSESGASGEGYGSIPFHRTEWTAERIVAYVSLDLAQLASYGLGEPAAALLATIARWEIRSLLDVGLRLRTACDLEPVSADVVDRAGEALPSVGQLESDLRRLIGQCADLLGDGKPIEVVWDITKARPTTSKKKA